MSGRDTSQEGVPGVVKPVDTPSSADQNVASAAQAVAALDVAAAPGSKRKVPLRAPASAARGPSPSALAAALRTGRIDSACEILATVTRDATAGSLHPSWATTALAYCPQPAPARLETAILDLLPLCRCSSGAALLVCAARCNVPVWEAAVAQCGLSPRERGPGCIRIVESGKRPLLIAASEANVPVLNLLLSELKSAATAMAKECVAPVVLADLPPATIAAMLSSHPSVLEASVCGGTLPLFAAAVHLSDVAIPPGVLVAACAAGNASAAHTLLSSHAWPNAALLAALRACVSSREAAAAAPWKLFRLQPEGCEVGGLPPEEQSALSDVIATALCTLPQTEVKGVLARLRGVVKGVPHFLRHSLSGNEGAGAKALLLRAVATGEPDVVTSVLEHISDKGALKHVDASAAVWAGEKGMARVLTVLLGVTAVGWDKDSATALVAACLHSAEQHSSLAALEACCVAGHPAVSSVAREAFPHLVGRAYEDGNVDLVVAGRDGRWAVVTGLLEAGECPLRRDVLGECVVDVALGEKEPTLRQLLVAHTCLDALSPTTLLASPYAVSHPEFVSVWVTALEARGGPASGDAAPPPPADTDAPGSCTLA